jgi:hypothetical protein
MRFPAFLIAILLLVAACQGPSADASSTPVPSSPSASPEPSAPASEAPGSEAPGSEAPSSQAPGSAEPIPSDALGPFTCELPIVEDPSVAVANIVDVRVGAHAGYDRVVFEFEQGTPELSLSRAEPPFFSEGSGFPVEVEGASFLALLMRGGTVQTDEGTSSYDGPREFSDVGPSLVHLVEGGDFERQSTWYLGLADEACVRVLLLDDPHRLVIDIEH